MSTAADEAGGGDAVPASPSQGIARRKAAPHPPWSSQRWVPGMYLVMSLFMAPWIVVLYQTLPDRAVSHNYRLAWVGFDVILMLAMGRTAWLAWRRSPFVVNVASATAALLVVDAWFDVMTAPRHSMFTACLLALAVELPLAVLSLVLSGRAQRMIATTGALPSRSWQTSARRLGEYRRGRHAAVPDQRTVAGGRAE